MRAVIQRVSSASVSVGSEIVGVIGTGLLVLLGIEDADTSDDLEWLATKLVNLRVFGSEQEPWSQSVSEIGGGILLISQFTLHASTRKGTKPSWHRAAKQPQAESLYEATAAALEQRLGRPVAKGRFGAMMQVLLINDGPVTLIIDSKIRE